MRLHRHRELWQELAHAAWLELPCSRTLPVHLRLLDAAVLDQRPGRRARCRAAHWAMHPAPLILPAAPPVLRLAALVLAAHTSGHTEHCIEMGILNRLCGHSPQQTAELLDRLRITRTLGTWHHDRETDQVLWQLPHRQHATDPPYGLRAGHRIRETGAELQELPFPRPSGTPH
jgi:hypothetical protein